MIRHILWAICLLATVSAQHNNIQSSPHDSAASSDITELNKQLPDNARPTRQIGVNTFTQTGLNAGSNQQNLGGIRRVITSVNQGTVGIGGGFNRVNVESGVTANIATVGSGITANRATVGSGITANRATVGSRITANRATVGSGITANRATVGSVITANRGTVGSGITANRGIVASVGSTKIPNRFTKGQFVGLPEQRPSVATLEKVQDGPYWDGSYYFRYVTEDGIVREEGAVPEEDGGLIVTGSYMYTDPSGIEIKKDYYSDRNGYASFSPGTRSSWFAPQRILQAPPLPVGPTRTRPSSTNTNLQAFGGVRRPGVTAIGGGPSQTISNSVVAKKPSSVSQSIRGFSGATSQTIKVPSGVVRRPGASTTVSSSQTNRGSSGVVRRPGASTAISSSQTNKGSSGVVRRPGASTGSTISQTIRGSSGAVRRPVNVKRPGASTSVTRSPGLYPIGSSSISNVGSSNIRRPGTPTINTVPQTVTGPSKIVRRPITSIINVIPETRPGSSGFIRPGTLTTQNNIDSSQIIRRPSTSRITSQTNTGSGAIRKPIISSVISTQAINRPIPTNIVQRPITTQIVRRPITAQVVSRPVTAQILQRPITTQAVQRPVTTQVLQNQVLTPVVQKPITTQKFSSPLLTQLSDERVVTNNTPNQGYLY